MKRIGFGSARTALGSSEHERALSKALAAGVSLIDTSSNYGDGGSEKLIGKLLKTTKEEDMSSDSPIASHHLLNFLFLRVQAWLRSNHPHSRLSSAMAPSASTHCRAG